MGRKNFNSKPSIKYNKYKYTKNMKEYDQFTSLITNSYVKLFLNSQWQNFYKILHVYFHF